MLSFLAEFLFSAILWGSLITWWFWRRRKTAIGRFRHGLLTLGMGWFGLHTAIAFYGFLLPPSGRLIDADSGEPIKNSRVIATWTSYPFTIWTSYCSGKQAHLTDADGDFAFRLAPAPTLVFGTLVRGLNPQVPGRIDNRKHALLLAPLWGDIPIQRYAPGRKLAGGPNTGCHVEILPQYDFNLEVLPGEEHPFEVMYREACVERQPWTFYDQYLQDMKMSGPAGRHAELPLNDPRLIAVFKLRPLIAPRGCPPIGDLCASPISADVHDTHCVYFSWLRELAGARQ